MRALEIARSQGLLSRHHWHFQIGWIERACKRIVFGELEQLTRQDLFQICEHLRLLLLNVLMASSRNVVAVLRNQMLVLPYDLCGAWVFKLLERVHLVVLSLQVLNTLQLEFLGPFDFIVLDNLDLLLSS